MSVDLQGQPSCDGAVRIHLTVDEEFGIKSLPQSNSMEVSSSTCFIVVLASSSRDLAFFAVSSNGLDLRLFVNLLSLDGAGACKA